MDASTGAVRARVTTERDDAFENLSGSASGSIRAELSETFTVTSGGSFTASIDYNGMWRMLGWTGDGPTWNVTGVLSLTGGTTAVDDVLFQFNPEFDFNADTAAAFGAAGLFSPSSGMVDALLTNSITAEEGDRVTVKFELLAEIGSSTRGIIDFSESAFLSIGFGDGLFAVPDDIRFLSFDTTVIPLPATGWLLLSGLGSLVALRRRRPAA